MNANPGWIKSKLEHASQPVLTIYAIIVAFSTYFGMYAFRKPFAAAEYQGLEFLGIDLKTVFVISQIIGYTLSKYIGIKVCSELKSKRRASALIFIILWAEAALILFAILPPSWKVVAIFLNGLSLGMVWGVVVGYLEGRQTSELLLAGLSCSFIVSSGMVKDVGLTLMNSYNVTEFWMPALTGVIFLPMYFISVWLLNQIPPPTQADIQARVEREPMYKTERHTFIKKFALGLTILFVAYFFLTAYRDIRDNYGANIFNELGFGEEPIIFTRTEWPVAFGVMLALAALNLIKNNRLGMVGAYVIMGFGTALIGVGTLLFSNGYIDGIWWMILTGLGSYLAYVPYGSVLFDRTIACTRVAGTAVFAIMVADAIGYSGSVIVQLYKDFSHSDISWLKFLIGYSYFMSLFGTILLIISCIYFLNKSKKQESTA